MVDRPFFSIITIVFNGEKYLERTIKSVINQSFKDFEYIIIDGESTDNTLNIIRKYEKQIDFWKSEPDEGISDAFNKGIKYAKGKYIAFINADDYYTENAFSTVYEIAKKEEKVGVFCGAVNFYDNEKFLISSPSDVNRITVESTIHHSSSFIKSDIFQVHQAFDKTLKYAMDYELFLRLHLEKVKFYPISEVLSERDINGTTLENSYKALEELRRIRKTYFNRLNVFLNFSFFYSKLFLGRVLRQYLLPIYQLYWMAKEKSSKRV